MGVSIGAAASSGVAAGPPIPTRGLDEVLRSWSGQGQLWEALAAVQDPVAERQWRPEDIRRRALRVLFEQLTPTLAGWPARTRDWLDALPAASARDALHASAPVAGTRWGATRRLGWPPRGFVARPRVRVPETLLSTVARWTLDELAAVVDTAADPADELQVRAHERADVALRLRGLEPLASTTPLMPTRSDLTAVTAEGRPWRSLAPVAQALRDLRDPGVLNELALHVVAPDPQLAWRLFHLAVLGEVLHALRTAGANAVSLRPLGDAVPGPAFLVKDAAGRAWDLWFEAAGAWGYYKRQEAYPLAAAGVIGAGSALGTDLMLLRLDERALLLECKYSWKPSVVARGGYEQTLAYAAETFELAPDLTAAVVGPEGVVQKPAFANTVAGSVGIVPPDAIAPLIEHAFAT